MHVFSGLHPCKSGLLSCCVPYEKSPSRTVTGLRKTIVTFHSALPTIAYSELLMLLTRYLRPLFCRLRALTSSSTIEARGIIDLMQRCPNKSSPAKDADR